jgi:methanogenic corrinoid protein MtbC1
VSDRSDFLQALVTSDRPAAAAIARRALAESGDVAQVYGGLLQESLYEVGHRWQTGDLTVAQEHAATATVQFVLSSLYMELPRTPPVRGVAVVAGLPGELHQLGAHMVADTLEADGWRVHFLGADVPVSSLLATIQEQAASLVGLSVTMPGSLPLLVTTIGALRRGFGSDLRVLVGGQGRLDTDVRSFGADASARDVVGARDVARELAA